MIITGIGSSCSSEDVSESDVVVINEFDSPNRGRERGIAKKNQEHTAELKNQGYREGNFPLPVGTVVTLFMDKVDRGHTDSLRLPGTIVFISIFIYIIN